MLGVIKEVDVVGCRFLGFLVNEKRTLFDVLASEETIVESAEVLLVPGCHSFLAPDSVSKAPGILSQGFFYGGGSSSGLGNLVLAVILGQLFKLCDVFRTKKFLLLHDVNNHVCKGYIEPVGCFTLDLGFTDVVTETKDLPSLVVFQVAKL